jgi:hypothetical protein
VNVHKKCNRKYKILGFRSQKENLGFFSFSDQGTTDGLLQNVDKGAPGAWEPIEQKHFGKGSLKNITTYWKQYMR